VHYCGGKIAASRISFSEQKADCGMETGTSECPSHNKNQLNNDCCKNILSVYSIEKSYKAPFFEFKQFTSKVLQVFTVPVKIGNLAANTTSHNINVSPQIYLKISEVKLPDICVFRI